MGFRMVWYRFRENSGQNFEGLKKRADFDLSNVKVIDRYFFSVLERGCNSRQTASNNVLFVKIGLAVLAAPSSKSVTSLKKRTNPYMLGICTDTSIPENLSKNKFFEII